MSRVRLCVEEKGKLSGQIVELFPEGYMTTISVSRESESRAARIETDEAQ